MYPISENKITQMNLLGHDRKLLTRWKVSGVLLLGSTQPFFSITIGAPVTELGVRILWGFWHVQGGHGGQRGREVGSRAGWSRGASRSPGGSIRPAVLELIQMI